MSFGLTLSVLATVALGRASVGYTSSDFAGCVRAVSAHWAVRCGGLRSGKRRIRHAYSIFLRLKSIELCKFNACKGDLLERLSH